MQNIASPAQLAHIGVIAAGLIRDGDRVGLGSGRAALAFVRALGERKLKIVGVSTSEETEKVAMEVGIPLATLEQIDTLDITVDGADEVDPALNLIKGGGGYLTREKIINAITKRFIIVVGEEKIVPQLCTKFPVFVELIDFALPTAVRKITAMGARVEQRRNADGSAFRTDNNNPYLHCWFPPLANPGQLHQQIRQLPLAQPNPDRLRKIHHRRRAGGV